MENKTLMMELRVFIFSSQLQNLVVWLDKNGLIYRHEKSSGSSIAWT